MLTAAQTAARTVPPVGLGWALVACVGGVLLFLFALQLRRWAAQEALGTVGMMGAALGLVFAVQWTLVDKDALRDAPLAMNATWAGGDPDVNMRDGGVICQDEKGAALQILPREATEPRQVALRVTRPKSPWQTGPVTAEVLDAVACSPGAR